MTQPLCRCLNCETIMFDENADVDQREYSDAEIEAAGITPRNMSEFEDGDESFDGCPVCKTDEYLEDVNEDL